MMIPHYVIHNPFIQNATPLIWSVHLPLQLISASTTPTQNMQNNALSTLSQNQNITQLTKTNFASKNALQTLLKPTDKNANEFWAQRLSELANLCPQNCQLIVSYPESQEHGETVTIEEESSGKERCGSEAMGSSDNCIDIESIMNPSNEEKPIPCLSSPAQEDSLKQYSCRDETKNIPKNYIKAVFSFILEQPLLIKKIFTKKRLELQNCEINKFLEFVRAEKKSKVYTIGRFKLIWLNQTYGKMMRIIYAYFLRKHSLRYIYTSKIENKMSHVRHRLRIFTALAQPEAFTNIK